MKEEQFFKNKNKKNTRNLGAWTLLWVFSLALVTFGHALIWNENTTISLVLLIVNTLIGIGMILANVRYLNGLDELQRKIHLEAMGICLGVALVAGITYSTMDVTNIIAFNAEISHLIILMGLTYLVSILIINARYK
ncbi:hypothetical protein MKO06_03720 [Gramella sp. GC03-9]|uniref:Uncharacterized protein n=1 Tax=Christiangramia oceanisediminis TaxID=2920386 RepID=A0A9X2KVA8_9FLAO|nr:hypothetical protein [Gramella oceanisediminis]MCP9199002.1 hypothetical protein [Gramella oceanisediminis]